MATFTQEELTVMFHILNNCHAASWMAAKERAAVCDDMTQEQFMAAYRAAIVKLSNMQGDSV